MEVIGICPRLIQHSQQIIDPFTVLTIAHIDGLRSPDRLSAFASGIVSNSHRLHRTAVTIFNHERLAHINLLCVIAFCAFINLYSVLILGICVVCQTLEKPVVGTMRLMERDLLIHFVHVLLYLNFDPITNEVVRFQFDQVIMRVFTAEFENKFAFLQLSCDQTLFPVKDFCFGITLDLLEGLL